MQVLKRRGRGAFGGERERLPGGPGPAAGAHPLQEGRYGNPGGRSTKSLPAPLAAAPNETVVVTIDGLRRTMVLGDFCIDEPAAQCLESLERAVLVRLHQARISGDVGGEDGDKMALDASFPCRLHGAFSWRMIVHEPPLGA